MKFKMTLFLGSAKFGWTETWWRDADQLRDVAEPVSTYIARRRAFLPSTCTIAGVRIGVEGESRMGSVYLPPGGPIAPGAPTILIPPDGSYPAQTAPGGTIGVGLASFDQARVAMQVSLLRGGRRYGTRYFSPVPDTVSGDDVASLIRSQEPAWWNAWTSWATYMTGDPNAVVSRSSSGWQIKTRSNATVGLEKDIIGWRVSAGADTDLQFELAAGDALPLTLKDKVVIRAARMRFTGMASPNGVWRIASITAPTGTTGQLVTIRYSRAISADNISSLGKVRVLAYTYVIPDDYRPMRCGIHKRGGPFEVTAGRVSRRTYAG